MSSVVNYLEVRTFSLLLFMALSQRGQTATYSKEMVDAALAHADFKGTIQIENIEALEVRDGIGRKSVATARVLSGPSQDTKIRILFHGGESQDRGFYYPGLPRPRIGKRYEASLKKSVDGDFEIAGLEAGLVDLNPDRNASRNRTDGSNGDGSGAYLYWDASYFPISYYVSEPTFRTHPEWVPELDLSFKTWRDLESIPIEFMAMGCSSSRFNENDGLNTVIYVTDSWPFDSAAIAITRNFYVAGTSEYSGLILDSDILINGVDHQFSINSEAGKHTIRNIVTHEIGHFLGLGHEISPVNSDSTMYAIASTGETKKESLGTSDIAGIQSAYHGVGQKLSNQHSYCKPTELNTGCRLGVRRGERAFPVGFMATIALLILMIPLARLFKFFQF